MTSGSSDPAPSEDSLKQFLVSLSEYRSDRQAIVALCVAACRQKKRVRFITAAATVPASCSKGPGKISEGDCGAVVIRS